jgi:hypothetical protein
MTSTGNRHHPVVEDASANGGKLHLFTLWCHPNSSSKAFASCKSGVSNPSVNQL